MPGSNVRPEVEPVVTEFDANAHVVADEEFPTMEEAVMLSRGIRTSISKSSTGIAA